MTKYYSAANQTTDGFSIGLFTYMTTFFHDAYPIASEIAAFTAAFIGLVGVGRIVLGWFHAKVRGKDGTAK